MDKSTIYIVSVCDNRYAILLGALLKSIAQNHTSPEVINYYIVDDGISASSKERLEDCAKGSNLNLQWVPFTEAIASKTNLPSDKSSFPVNVYLRLMIPNFLPKEAERALYLDVDMIVEKDITELWSKDLAGKPIAAVVDRSELVSSEWGGIKNYKELGLRKEARYFNSGLLIMDLAMWRNNNYGDQVIEVVNKNKEFAFFPDQYGLNVVFADNWMELDKRWNTLVVTDVEDPCLIHFIGIKPIFAHYDGLSKYKERFYFYLNDTAWKGYKPQAKWKWMYNKLINKYFSK